MGKATEGTGYVPKKELTYTPLWFDMRDMFAALPAETCKAIVLAMIDYARDGKTPDFGGDSFMQAMFVPIRSNINSAIRGYVNRCAANKGNADKGAEKRRQAAANNTQDHATACDGMQPHAAVSDGMQRDAKRANTIQDKTLQDSIRQENTTSAQGGAAERSVFKSRDDPVTLPLANGDEWVMPEQTRNELVAAYPAIDINTEMRKARAWLLADAKRRRSADRMPQFVTRWVSQARPNEGNKPSFGSMQNNQYDFDELERQILAAQERDTAQE